MNKKPFTKKELQTFGEVCRKNLIEDIRKMINKYLKEEKELCLDIRKEWKKGRNCELYSNQYYAFMELQSFWKDLKEQIK